MKKLLLILCVLALPAFSSAGDLVAVPDSGPNLDSNATPRSFLASDIFIRLAHTCQTGTTTCSPDNVVTGPFGALIRVDVLIAQSYQFFFLLVDIEGALVGLASGTFPLPVGTTSVFSPSGFSVPGSSSVATRGLYKFIALVIGANGQATFSPYYGPVRVLP